MKERSTQKEIMDLGPSHYTQTEYEGTLKKLFLVGKYIGIHRDTIRVLDACKPKTVLDVGCGDGAFLSLVAKRFPESSCLGIDISSQAIKQATRYKGANIDFACTDKLASADVIMANLVCHHMADVELKQFLQQAYEQAHRLVLINDLQRHRIAKALFSMLSGPLFSNRLISNDGKVSIERSFWRSELEAHLKKLCPNSYTISWRFPFRWQVLIWKK